MPLNSQQPLVEPQIVDVLKNLKRDIFVDMNCIKIGKIVTLSSNTKTAEVQILFKRVRPDGTVVSYDKLLDCPVFRLQGGGAVVDLPVTAGDECLVLFSDRNIEAWFQTGSEAAPADSRCHDLSDGIALVGLNSLVSDAVNFVMRLGFKDGKVVIQNATGTMLSVLSGLIDVLKALTDANNVPLSSASIAALEAQKFILAGLLHS